VAEEKRKAEEEAKRKRQEKAELLKSKEEAAKREVALEARRKADEEAARIRQEEAEQLKSKEEAAKREAALDAKRKADKEKVKQAEEEARRKAEAEKQRLAEEQEAQSKAEEPPASQIMEPARPPNPSAGRRLPMTGLVVLGGVVIAAILVVVITEREPARESYRPAADAPAKSTQPLKLTRSAQEMFSFQDPLRKDKEEKQREEQPKIKSLSLEDALRKLREEKRREEQSSSFEDALRELREKKLRGEQPEFNPFETRQQLTQKTTTQTSAKSKIESLKEKLKQNSKYEPYGINLWGKERFSLKNKLKAVKINATTYKSSNKDKIRLYCSDITDEEVEELKRYLGINVNIRILRDGLPGGYCSGGNNQVEIYFGTGSS